MVTLEQFQEEMRLHGAVEYLYYPNLGRIAWHYSTGNNIEVLFLEAIRGYGAYMYCHMVERLIAKNEHLPHSLFGFRRKANEEAARFYTKMNWTQIELGSSLYPDGEVVLLWITWENLLKRLHIIR